MNPKPPLLVLATGNPNKVVELRHLLQDVFISPVTATDLGLALPAEEPYATFRENAAHKALSVARQTDLLVLGEDSGLEVDALDGRPGVHSKRYSGPQGDARANNDKLLDDLRNVPWPQRKARFRCVLALASADKVLFTATGECAGIIANESRGSGGFGYDPLFYLPERNRTMAELSANDKNRISHRSRALVKARAFIRQYAVEAEAP
ncbi:MAG: RdgB/HAM1 family non-canonical purine NTP pyrophosphatase [Chloroflexi bacterium]|nr:RdgB/HAM1 family non-canonical purine NTP pyrophosphatase [Chloroflexota bacterium]